MPFLYRRKFFFSVQYLFLASSVLLLATYPVSAQQQLAENISLEEKSTSTHSSILIANEPSVTTEAAFASRNIEAQRLLIEAAIQYTEDPFALAEAYLAVGDELLADRLYQQALSQAQVEYDALPGDDQAQRLADVHIALGNFDLADQILQEAVMEISKSYPSRTDSYHLGRIALSYGKFPDENLAHRRLKAIYEIETGTDFPLLLVEDIVSVYAQFDDHKIAQRELAFLSAEFVNYIDTSLTLESTAERPLTRSTIYSRARSLINAPEFLFDVADAQREQGDIDGARESVNRAVRVETESALAIAEEAKNDPRLDFYISYRYADRTSIYIYVNRLLTIAKEQSMIGERAAAIERIEHAEAIATEMNVLGWRELNAFVNTHIKVALAYSEIGEVEHANDVLVRADEAVERDRNRISDPVSESLNLSHRSRLAIAHGKIGNVTVEQNNLEQVFDELIELYFTGVGDPGGGLTNSIVRQGIVVYSNTDSIEKADDYLVIMEDWINRSVAAGGSYLRYLDLAAAARERGDIVAADRLSQASLPLVQLEENVSRFDIPDIARSVRHIENPGTLRLALEEVDRLAESVLQAETDTRRQEDLRDNIARIYLGAI